MTRRLQVGHNRFITRWTLGGVLAMFFIADVMAAAVIDNIRVRTSPERTRIVLDTSEPLDHKIFALVEPDRLVIDVPHANLQVDASQVSLGDGPIQGLRNLSSQ